MSETTFIAKVSLNYDHAQERISELGAFFREILPAFEDERHARIIINRFTFGCYLLNASNAAECENALRTAWEKTFGDTAGISEIMVARYGTDTETWDENADDAGDDGNSEGGKSDGSTGSDDGAMLEREAAGLMRSIFKNVYGAGEYQHLIMDLNETIPVLRKKNALDILFAQNYLISVDPGCGFTTLISSFGDYLHNMHVYPEEEFESRLLYTEMKLGKETENGFANADSVIDYLYSDSESRSYKIIGLDITYYLEGRKYPELRNFISRLDAYQDKYILLCDTIPSVQARLEENLCKHYKILQHLYQLPQHFQNVGFPTAALKAFS